MMDKFYENEIKEDELLPENSNNPNAFSEFGLSVDSEGQVLPTGSIESSYNPKTATVNFGDSVASANLRNSNDTERAFSSSTVYIKTKEVKLNSDLEALTIKFDGDVTGGTAIGNAQIYINGVPTGTVQSITAVYTTFSENFPGPYPAGTLIQIYGKVDVGAGNMHIKNFRFYYDKELATDNNTFSTAIYVIVGTKNQDP